MRRRGLTVVVGCVLLAMLLFPILWVNVPYVELGPGPTVDTLGQVNGVKVITVTGAEATASRGRLHLVTVSVRSNLTLMAALRGWLDTNTAVVPRDLVYPPHKSEKQVDAENEREFQESQSSAETAALRELGYPVAVTVTGVSDGFPAAGVLAVHDVIEAVDGKKIDSARSLSESVRSKPVSASRQVTYTRGSETKTVAINTAKGSDGLARLGVVVEERQSHPFTLKIELDKIGGPSAGLMFALGIIDILRPEDLTGGFTIVGTGTIDSEGKVGPIGGIQQKLVAAKRAKAKVFLTPESNCAEAVASAPEGLPLVKVGSLHDALDALRALRENRMPAMCPRP